MELRRLLLSALLALGGGTAAYAAIRAYPLDERTVYTIRISAKAPTTCVFPQKLTALEGAQIAQKPADGAAVLLSYQPGAEFFSVRALRDDATAALNVVLREKIYVLCFVADGEPDRAVTFLDEPLTGTGTRAPRVTPAEMLALVERAKHYQRIAAEYPALVSTIARAEPGSVTHYRDFAVIIEAVFRFEAEDTLVFRLRFENSGDAPVYYAPEQLAVRAGADVFPAQFSEASGAIAPKTQTRGFLAITGGTRGGRANLSVHEKFFVIVPHGP